MAGNIGTDSGWAEETCLDVEWAHAIAPDAKILLVEAKSPSESDLLQAVDYARNRPDVVSVSMSWGSNESYLETNWDYHFTSSYGAVFFASSGDKGSGVIWPASSPNVVAVGGTTLKIDSVISETAWSGSGGGISNFEPIPDYQTNFGLTTPKRSVPDVSYNADPSTGVSVYCNSQWLPGKMGGTSAGAPQWAAIYALDRSATNNNLYGKAKSVYSAHFRDITSGSNGGYNATIGYDYVTGLGSPLTDNFGTALTISPSSGPAGGTVTLNGVGFSLSSSANISWLNPLKSTWASIANNVTTDYAGNFAHSFNASDLLQNNLAGDNQPSFDNIVFRAQDNSNGKSYNSSVPYSEWRRGLTKICNLSATGLFGNNTDLSATAFIQNNQSIIVTGNWFNPNATGVASFFWDGTKSLGSAAIDASGQFNATFRVPTASAGQHTIAINDGAANFCINITCLPALTDNYTAGWHTIDIAIDLITDSTVNETFYKINNGPVFSVTANGQPIITTEGSNNTLEYWSTWNIYGNITKELPHITVQGIQLQKTPPQGSIQINNGATSTSEAAVTLTITATDLLSGVSQIRFSNDDRLDQVPWEPYDNTASWNLTSGDGVKTVYCQIMDNAGLIANFNASIVLSTPQPLQIISPATTPNSFPTPSSFSTPTITPDLPQVSSATESPSPEPSKTPLVPEFSIQVIVVLIALSTLSFAVVHKRKRKSDQ